MKIRVEFDLDTDKVLEERWRLTKVFLDGVEVNNRCTFCSFRHQAGEFPELSLRLLEHIDGQPYVNKDKTDAAFTTINVSDGKFETKEFL